MKGHSRNRFWEIDINERLRPKGWKSISSNLDVNDKNKMNIKCENCDNWGHIKDNCHQQKNDTNNSTIENFVSYILMT